MPSIIDQLRDEEARDELLAWEANWRDDEPTPPEDEPAPPAAA